MNETVSYTTVKSDEYRRVMLEALFFPLINVPLHEVGLGGDQKSAVAKFIHDAKYDGDIPISTQRLTLIAWRSFQAKRIIKRSERVNLLQVAEWQYYGDAEAYLAKCYDLRIACLPLIFVILR